MSFETAATVLLDPLGVTIPDAAHSDIEERWSTLGRAANGWLLVVVHTWEDLDANSVRVRLISARYATNAEKFNYAEGQ